MENVIMNGEGYYKVFRQEWFETSDSKTGWDTLGWNNEEGYEIVEHLEFDKFGNPTVGLFKYNEPIFLGMKQAVWNVQAGLLNEYMNFVKEHLVDGMTKDDLMEKCPELKKVSTAIDVLEERYEIKKYLGMN